MSDDIETTDQDMLIYSDAKFEYEHKHGVGTWNTLDRMAKMPLVTESRRRIIAADKKTETMADGSAQQAAHIARMHAHHSLWHGLLDYGWSEEVEAFGRKLAHRIADVILRRAAPAPVEAGLAERLRNEASFWVKATNTITGPEVARLCDEAASALSALQSQVEALTHEVESAGSLRLRMEAHRQGKEAAEAEVTRLRQRVEEMDAALDFVAVWAWRFDPPNANNVLTDDERLSAIKYHPAVRARTKEPNNV